jgi:hypothetical protein
MAIYGVQVNMTTTNTVLIEAESQEEANRLVEQMWASDIEAALSGQTTPWDRSLEGVLGGEYDREHKPMGRLLNHEAVLEEDADPEWQD